MEHSAPRIYLRSLLFSYLLSGLLLLLISLAMYRFQLKESQVRVCVTLVYILSGALAGFLAGRGFKRQRFFCGFLAGLLYFLVLLAVSMALGQGLNPEPVQLATVFALCAGGGILGGVLS